MPKQTKRRGGRKKTRRPKLKGGVVARLEEIINSVPMRANLNVNPRSRFVVATYWWGRGRNNNNLQYPCPEDAMDHAKEIAEEGLVEEDPEYKTEIFEPFDAIATIRKQRREEKKSLTAEETARFKETLRKRLDYLTPYFNRPDIKAQLTQTAKEFMDKQKTTNPKYRAAITYDAMIAKWEQVCMQMNCNYLAVEYPQFAVPGGYQLAINAKPLFIKKALEHTEGRGVLYIDGDMFIRQYPKIFDMPDIDFGARSWNFDPRSSARFKEDVCFDPYIFETSGGTMFFANSPVSNQLLDAWAIESSLPKNTGKADDRILSQVFTVQTYAMKANTLHLPIEYLWLTDLFSKYDFAGMANESECIIDHPYCLTGEERAAEMSQSSVDRQPPGYDRQIGDQIDCGQTGGTFYEYIFFPTRDMVDSFGPYLNYMRKAVNFNTKKPMFTVVDFDDKYGKYSVLALKNFANARTVVLQGATKTEVRLPLMPPITHVLAALVKGLDVYIGDEARQPPYVEFAGRNYGKNLDAYLVNLQLDHTTSMFISAKNPIIIHLLAMCNTLEDVNIHLKESFVFLSRIRWSLRTAQGEQSALPGFSLEKM